MLPKMFENLINNLKQNDCNIKKYIYFKDFA